MTLRSAMRITLTSAGLATVGVAVWYLLQAAPIGLEGVWASSDQSLQLFMIESTDGTLTGSSALTSTGGSIVDRLVAVDGKRRGVNVLLLFGAQGKEGAAYLTLDSKERLAGHFAWAGSAPSLIVLNRRGP